MRDGRTSKNKLRAIAHHLRWALLLVPMVILLLTVVRLVPMYGQTAPPAVVTDKTAYLAGEIVGISGRGFQSGEVVTLRATHASGEMEPGMGHDAFSAIADANGRFVVTWAVSLNPWDTGSNDFVLQAAGSVSGPAARAGFHRIATVRTNKYDYAPGETAVITGAGFRPSSAVSIRVEHSNGKNDGPNHLPSNVLADADGRVNAAWFVDPADSVNSIFRLTATGSESGLTATTTFTDPPVTFIDDKGADDLPGQKDLNYMQVDNANVPTSLGVAWGWDDTGWSGGNTGDACALFDTDADGFANYSLCVTVQNSPAAFLATRLYVCSDQKSDRCTNPDLVPSFASTATASVVTGADPFGVGVGSRPSNACDETADCRTADTVANATVSLSDFGGATARLTNVCTYPSQEPNSDPSDCVVSPKSGFLTIIKAVQNSSLPADTFTFDASAPSQSGADSWSHLGPGTVVSQISYAPGTLDLTETVPSLWKLDSAVCEIQSAPPAVTGTKAGDTVEGLSIQEGLETICTFTNSEDVEKTHARLTLVKVVTNDNGGDKVLADFPLKAEGPTATDVISGVSGTTGISNVLVRPGTYALSETNEPGYAASAWVCTGTGSQNGPSITLAATQSATCTITNDDIGPKLTLVKSVTNDNGGNANPDDFKPSVGGTTVVSAAKNTYQANLALAINETQLPGYSFVSITGNAKCPAALGGSITLAVGDDISCMITNDDIAPSLTLVKSVTNDSGGQRAPAEWTLIGNGGAAGTLSGVGPIVASSATFKLGTYALSESGPTDYSTTGYSCVKNAGPAAAATSITLGLGDAATCTINNNDKPGTIVIKKIIKPTGSSTSFSFASTGAGYNSFTLAGGTENSQTLNAGVYSVTELVPLGWVLTGIGGSTDPSTPYNCTVSGGGGSTGVGDLVTATATVSLKNGDTVTCMFENTGRGATRTQGFWATHPQLASIAWFGGTAFGHTFPGVASVGGIGDGNICTRPLDSLGKVTGSFWSDVSKTSTGGKRTALDQARMQLLQQLIAAELNASAFGSVPGGVTFATMESALCGTDQTAIKNAQQQAASFNTTGDSTTFTPGTSADSKNARAIANVPFWNIIKP
jgi:hypothetical protein